MTGGGAKAFHIPVWATAKVVVTRCPKAASFPDCNGRLPLHHAVQKGAPLAVVKAIYSAHEEAVSHTDEEDRLCLHLVTSETPATVVEFLVKAKKEACTVLDLNNRVPLMMAVQNGCGIKAVNSIHRAAPKLLATSVDKNRKTILHFITAKTPLKVAEMLLAESPPQLPSQRDGFSKFPVQNAIGLGVTGKVLQAITLAYPTGRNAFELWRACNLGEWTRCLELASKDPAACALPSQQDGGFHSRAEASWFHYPLQVRPAPRVQLLWPVIARIPAVNVSCRARCRPFTAPLSLFCARCSSRSAGSRIRTRLPPAV